MAACLVKNELLCFATNKIHSTPFEDVTKAIIDFYQEDQIQEAKELLWETGIKDSAGGRRDLRLIKRRDNGTAAKVKADTEDILKALLISDKEGWPLPIYCAVDVANIPTSASPSDGLVAASQLLQLQCEIKQMRGEFSSSMGKMEKRIQEIQKDVSSATTATANRSAAAQVPSRLFSQVVSTQRQSAAPSASCPPPASSTPPVPAQAAVARSGTLAKTSPTQSSPASPVGNNRGAVAAENQPDASISSAAGQVSASAQSADDQTDTSVAGQAATPEPSVADDQDGFTLVSRKRNRTPPAKVPVRRPLRGVVGLAKANMKLSGVAPSRRRISVFVGRLSEQTTCNDIFEHVLACLGSQDNDADVKVNEISDCIDKFGYRGFKIDMFADRVCGIMCEDKWPSYVTCKRYFPPRTLVRPKPTDTEPSAAAQGCLSK